MRRIHDSYSGDLGDLRRLARAKDPMPVFRGFADLSDFGDFCAPFASITGSRFSARTAF
jgi:hypothetical protein